MKSELSKYATNMSPSKTKRSEKVTKITIHHTACIASAQSIANAFAVPRRCASANYIIGKDGEILCDVDEDYRAWTSGNAWNDQRAITIEVSNCSGKPNWEISEKCMKALVELCADICRRYCIVPYFDGTKNASLTFHCFYQATECPGPYIKKNIKNIITMINNELCLQQKPVETPKPKEDETTSYKVKVTCKCLNIRAGAGTKYKVVGSISDNGVYTIVETNGNWGKLKSGKGWIYLKGYTKKVQEGVKMDANSIVTLVGSLGFPIVACIGLGWFITTELRNLRAEHKAETDKMTEALNNNTLVIQKLIDKMGGD